MLIDVAWGILMSSPHEVLQLHFWQRRLLVASQILQPLDGNPGTERSERGNGVLEHSTDGLNSGVLFACYGNPSACTMVAMVSNSVHSGRVVWLWSCGACSVQSFDRLNSTLLLAAFKPCFYVFLMFPSALLLQLFDHHFRHPSITTLITDDQWIKWINVLINMTICSYWCVIYIIYI